jgi:hypothetical protein
LHYGKKARYVPSEVGRNSGFSEGKERAIIQIFPASSPLRRAPFVLEQLAKGVFIRKQESPRTMALVW